MPLLHCTAPRALLSWKRGGHHFNHAQREVHPRRVRPSLFAGQSRRTETRARLAEFDITQAPLDIAEVLVAHNPKIIGFGIYIWNLEPTSEVIATIKRIRPEIKSFSAGRRSAMKRRNKNRPACRPRHHRRGGFKIRGSVPRAAFGTPSTVSAR